MLFVSDHLGTDHLWAVPVKDGTATSTPVSVMKGFSPSRVVGMTPQGTLLYSIGSWGTQSVIARLDGPGGNFLQRNLRSLVENARVDPLVARWPLPGLSVPRSGPDDWPGAPSVVIVRISQAERSAR